MKAQRNIQRLTLGRTYSEYMPVLLLVIKNYLRQSLLSPASSMSSWSVRHVANQLVLLTGKCAIKVLAHMIYCIASFDAVKVYLLKIPNQIIVQEMKMATVMTNISSREVTN